jgi:hypothetical protein
LVLSVEGVAPPHISLQMDISQASLKETSFDFAASIGATIPLSILAIVDLGE